MSTNNSNIDLSDRDLITALRKLGKSGELTEETRHLLSELESSGINRRGPKYWDIVCSQLNTNEQCDLFKGLVIAERELGLTGGSVSATSKVFRMLADSIPLADAYSLAAWSTEMSPNPYTPISSINAHLILRSFREHMLSSGFRTFSQAYASADARFDREKRDEYKRRQEDARRSEEERQSERAAVNSQKQTRWNERSRERLAQIELAAVLSPSERLSWLASTTLPLP